MSEKSAFPHAEIVSDVWRDGSDVTVYYSGMTYREYVAAGVMAAFGVRDDHKTWEDAARSAVRMADALIAELEKHKEK